MAISVLYRMSQAYNFSPAVNYIGSDDNTSVVLSAVIEYVMTIEYNVTTVSQLIPDELTASKLSQPVFKV